MSKIDEIFKSGLDDKGIAYQEQHWQDMLEVIEGSEKKKGIVFKKWHVLLLGLLLGAGSSSIWFYSQNNFVAQKAETNQQGTNKPLASDHTNNTIVRINESEINEEHIPEDQSETIVVIKENTLSNRLGVINTPEENEEVISKVPTVGIEQNELPPLKEDLLKHSLQLKKPSLLSNSSDVEESKRTNFYPPAPYVKWFLFLSPFYEFGWANNGNSSPDFAIINKEESLFSSKAIGIHLTAKKKNFAFNIGVAKRSYVTKTNYSSVGTNWTYDTTLTMVNRNHIKNSNGNWVALMKNKIDSTAQNYSKVDCPDCETKFSFISIPLSTHYELKRRKFVLYGELGAMVNVLTSSKGLYGYFENGEAVARDVEETKDLNKVQLSANIAAGLKYSLTPSVNLWGSFGRRFGLNSWTKSYNNSPSFDEVKLGIEYRL